MKSYLSWLNYLSSYTRSRNEGTRHHREAERPSCRRNDNLQGPRAVLVDSDTSKETFTRWSGPRGSCAESVNLANALRDHANCTRIAYAYCADFFSHSPACNLRLHDLYFNQGYDRSRKIIIVKLIE